MYEFLTFEYVDKTADLCAARHGGICDLSIFYDLKFEAGQAGKDFKLEQVSWNDYTFYIVCSQQTSKLSKIAVLYDEAQYVNENLLAKYLITETTHSKITLHSVEGLDDFLAKANCAETTVIKQDL
jgi:hypothetical protein